jgi:hypothetical protein
LLVSVGLRHRTGSASNLFPSTAALGHPSQRSRTVAADTAEGLCTYLRFHNINATLPDITEGEYVTLRIDDNADEDAVQPLIDDWNREVYGASAGSGTGQPD